MSETITTVLPAIPEHWAWATLGDCVLEIRKGIHLGSSQEEVGLPVTTIEAMQHRSINPARVRYIADVDRAEVARFAYRSGDLVFSNINTAERLGSVAMYTGSPEILLHGANLLRLRIGHDMLHPRFLYWYMQSPFFRAEMHTRALPSVRQFHIGIASLADIPVPVPPYAEQERLAARLDALFERVDTVAVRLRRVETLIVQCRRAVLSAAATGRLTEDYRSSRTLRTDAPAFAQPVDAVLSEPVQGWYAVPMKTLLGDYGLLDGPFGSMLKAADDTTAGVRVVEPDNVGRLVFNPAVQRYISTDKYRSLMSHTVQEGDLLFSSYVDEGVYACLLPALSSQAIVGLNCFCIRPTDAVHKEYLAIQLCSTVCEAQLQNLADDSGRPTVSMAQFRSLLVPLCSLAEQEEIIARVRALTAVIDRMEGRCRRARTYLHTVEPSVLALAFRGDLVEHERGDDGRRLLERIRAERIRRGEQGR